MRPSDQVQLNNQSEGVDLITTDVFDTLLLRTLRSERSRIAIAEASFSSILRNDGINISVYSLMQARMSAQKLGFRAIQASGLESELRLADVIDRQLSVLGIPLTYASIRLELELDVETHSLRPNLQLAGMLQSFKTRGIRICAVSDTTLSETQIKRLISHFHGPDLLDSIYSSADVGLTKRGSGIFNYVLKSENVQKGKCLHIGDDPIADIRAPRSLGIKTFHTPRSKILNWARRMDGLATTLKFTFLPRKNTSTGQKVRYTDRRSFGYFIFGPIVSQFCERIWLYAAQAATTHRPVILFCSRGGVGIREAFEVYIQNLQLKANFGRENVMISRLAVARGACLARSEAAAQELSREFRGDRLCEVAKFLGGGEYVLNQEWEAPFNAESFFDLLETESGSSVRRDIEQQHLLFSEHISKLVGDADRVILCDTGLYGSTQRLLEAAMTQMPIETIQFARANYKRHSEEHFSRVAGLIVENDVYNPFLPETSVLRFWHLIEQLFEPSIPSAKTFARDESGEVIANCGNIRFGCIDPSSGNPLLSGALDYIKTLSPPLARFQSDEALAASRQLRRAICRPSELDLEALQFGSRSIDFGRPETVDVITTSNKQSLISRLRNLKSQYWREGAIAKNFPILKYPLLHILSAMHTARLARHLLADARISIR